MSFFIRAIINEVSIQIDLEGISENISNFFRQDDNSINERTVQIASDIFENQNEDLVESEEECCRIGCFSHLTTCLCSDSFINDASLLIVQIINCSCIYTRFNLDLFVDSD